MSKFHAFTQCVLYKINSLYYIYKRQLLIIEYNNNNMQAN